MNAHPAWPSDWPAGGVLFWFRNDLRLHDAPALCHAIAVARARHTWLLPVVLDDSAQTQATTAWGFARQGAHRRSFRQQGIAALAHALRRLGADLWVCDDAHPVPTLSDAMRQLQASELVCEDIAAPEEQATITALRQAGVRVTTVWQSTLYAPESLPMPLSQVPDTFTTFRRQLEAASCRESPPLATPPHWPTPPSRLNLPMPHTPTARLVVGDGGEASALAHLQSYCTRGLPYTYKSTRNHLMGQDSSSRWSPWLATGALSARQAMQAVRECEAERGATESTYWLWFELLWRDHFRWMLCKHGRLLYRPQGLRQDNTHALPPHRPAAFERWRHGETGIDLVDAGMRELGQTGWLSNRMRQIVASAWLHELRGDWRTGAAWFEHALIDFDPYSNQGNWAYMAGVGTDPRGGRRFNLQKQAEAHDPNGAYRQRWTRAAVM